MHRYYKDLLELNVQPLIIDCGANIGASSVYFKLVFPDAKIVAIEPEISNYQLLAENVKQFSIDVTNVAIGSQEGHMWLSNPGLSDWGFRVGDTGDYEVDVLTPNAVLEKYDRCAPFIIKIDIEGSELNLFETATEWVAKFSLLIVELHDWMLPLEGNSKHLIRCIAEHNFDVVLAGENIFLFNIDLLKKQDGIEALAQPADRQYFTLNFIDAYRLFSRDHSSPYQRLGYLFNQAKYKLRDFLTK